MSPSDCRVCMDLAARLIRARLDNNQSEVSDVRVLQRRHFDESHRPPERQTA